MGKRKRRIKCLLSTFILGLCKLVIIPFGSEIFLEINDLNHMQGTVLTFLGFYALK